MKWRALGHHAGVLVALLVAVFVVVMVAPIVVKMMPPSRLAVADDWIGRIWWPATAIRLLVYALLAWGLYPAWVRAKRSALAVQPADFPPEEDVDPQAAAPRAALAARLAHLQRAAQRQWVVFGLLAGSDVLIAQFPYWLLRG